MKTYETYSENDVVFISLTEEDAASRAKIEAWTQQHKIPWPVGYGAAETLAALEVPGFPTTFVIGRDGKVAWHRFLSGSLDRAIRNALSL